MGVGVWEWVYISFCRRCTLRFLKVGVLIFFEEFEL